MSISISVQFTCQSASQVSSHVHFYLGSARLSISFSVLLTCQSLSQFCSHVRLYLSSAHIMSTLSTKISHIVHHMKYSTPTSSSIAPLRFTIIHVRIVTAAYYSNTQLIPSKDYQRLKFLFWWNCFNMFQPRSLCAAPAELGKKSEIRIKKKP